MASTPKIESPELRLLLACARTRLDEGALGRIRAAAGGGVDWKRFAELAERHGLAPLALQGLRAAAPEGTPAAVLEALHRDAVANASQSLFMHQELLRLLGALKKAGIRALPYKGTAIAALAYGNLALRQCGDIDLIIRKPDYLRVKALLRGEKYRPLKELTPAEEAEYLGSPNKYHFPFTRRAPKADVEIHWGFTMKVYRFWWFDPERLWARAAPLAVGGREMEHLSVADTLIVLCVHGSSHYWNRLKWICDVAELIQRVPIDWRDALARASELRCRRRLLLGLRAARDFLGAELPPDVAGLADADPAFPALIERIGASFLSEEEPYDVAFMLQTADGRRGKLRYYAWKAFAPTEEDRKFLPLPRGLSFLYAIVRPLRLLIRHGFKPPGHD